MFDIEPPRTTAALRESLAGLHVEVSGLVASMSLEEFHSRQGEHWSPAEHLRHLITAIGALTQGMSVPRPLLTLRFGLSRRGSGTFEEVRALYREALRAGGQASGRYDPTKGTPNPEPEALRELLMRQWVAAGGDLDRAIGAWPERSLDRQQAKHPLLGTMTVRELLYFTLYHNAHHARRIAERRRA